MDQSRSRTFLSRFFLDYGMLLALLALCLFFSFATWGELHPEGADGGEQAARLIAKRFASGTRVMIAAPKSEENRQFAEALGTGLEKAGFDVVATVLGSPADARRALEKSMLEKTPPQVIGCVKASAEWKLFENLSQSMTQLGQIEIVSPKPYNWSIFLTGNNLLNVANQIVVIAIIAIGMTMVIITGGIDLSVGSLIAFSAVVAAFSIRELAGAEQASALGMGLSAMAAVALCAALGLFTGLMVTLFAIPPFIVTLGMMLVASGLAYMLSEGQSIYQVPGSFTWLGRGTVPPGVPISVLLMALLYGLAHILMARTALGRYVYAVGGNREAARLSGVPVTAVLLFVYTLCGALAGLGGVITASQLKSGSATYGLMYELYVIAAVVVGGTSLAGGEGKIFGTLIGAFIIAVIQNGMNLIGVESYAQKVVLGMVILGAVLLDTLKRRGFALFRRSRQG